MSDESRVTNHATLLQRLHQASQALVSADDESEVGEALMSFAASDDVDVARLIIFTDFLDDHPLTVEMREGWTRDGRPVLPRGTPLADYPLLDLMRADSTVACEDVLADERLNDASRHLMSRSGLRSFAIIPIRSGQKDASWHRARSRPHLTPGWLGAIFIARDSPSTFAEELITAWWMLGSQAAVTLNSHRLRRDAEQRLQGLTALLATSNAVSSSLELDVILETTAQQITRVLGTDGCAISLWDRDQDALVLKIDYAAFRGQWHTDEPGTIYHLSDMPAARKVLNSRQPIVVQASDPTADPAELAWMTAMGTASVLSVPMIVRDEVVGLLDLTQSTKIGEREFSPNEIVLCQTLANQAAAALENARLFEQTERRSVQLVTAAEVSRAATSILEPEDLIQQVVSLVRDRFDLYYVGLFLVDETGEWTGEPGRWAVLRAATGEAGRVQIDQDHKLEIGSDSMIGWCVGHAQTRISQDVGEESTRFVNPLLPETRSEMALPLLSRGKVIGAMTIQSTQPTAFTKDDVSALQTLADQLANAIHNARLFEESSRQTTELVTLNFISSAVSRSLEVSDLLDTVLNAVISVMGFDTGLISLADQETGQLYLAAHLDMPEALVRKFEEQGLEGTLCDVVFQSGESLGLGDLRQGAPLDVAGLIRQGLLAYAGIPLTYQNQTLGTICIFGRSARDTGSIQLSLLQAIGRQIGVGVQNARLFNQAQRQLVNLSIIQDTMSALTAAQSSEEAVRVLLRQAAAAVRADRVSMFLIDTEHMTRIGTYPISEEGEEMIGQTSLLADYPLTKQVVDTRQAFAVMADDSKLQEHARQAFKASGVVANATIPLVGRDGVIGTLAISLHQAGRSFSDHDMRLLQTLADQATIAFERIRSFEAAQTQTEDLSRLFDVSQALTAAVRKPKEIVEIIARGMAGLGNLECSISLLEPDGDTMRVLADFVVDDKGAIQPSNVMDDFRLTDYPATRRVMETAQPLVVHADDADADPAELAYMREYDTRTLAILPLAVEEHSLGVMELEWSSESQYRPELLSLIMTLSNQAAIAIQNARLFEETQRRARREQALRRVVSAVNASEDVIEDLGGVAQMVCEFTPANVMTLCSYNPGDAEFTYFSASDQNPDTSTTRRGFRLPIRGSGPEWVITNKELWLVRDLRQQQRFVEDERMLQDGIITRLIMPLHVGDRVIGTLNLGSPQPDAFSQEDLSFLGQVADQLALALERMRLLDEMRHALAEVQATHGRYLRDGWEGTLSTGPDRVWGYIDGPEGLAATNAIWTPEIEQAIASGAVVTLDEEADGQRTTARSGLAVPIRLLGQTIGVLDFYDEDRVWTEDDRALVATLADQVALALENQRLFEQTQRRAHREHMTTEIVSRIRAAGDVERILATAAEELGRALGVSRTRVRLGKPTNNSPLSQERESTAGKLIADDNGK